MDYPELGFSSFREALGEGLGSGSDFFFSLILALE